MRSPGDLTWVRRGGRSQPVLLTDCGLLPVACEPPPRAGDGKASSDGRRTQRLSRDKR